jgi:catechol 2,3-dioxygenase-like lactoylglutathione lyase family enzyme
VIDHIGITCADYKKSQELYDTVLGALGFSRQMDVGRAIGYGRAGKPPFWISDGAGLGPNRAVHLAFEATDETAVPAFHEALSVQGGAGPAESSPASGRCPQHAPRLWPEYHPGYFGAFVRDPDGNNAEAVCHAASAGP